jgi:hypothetical protein
LVKSPSIVLTVSQIHEILKGFMYIHTYPDLGLLCRNLINRYFEFRLYFLLDDQEVVQGT